MKLFKNIGKTRGISPVVALLLLLGVTMVAGAIAISTVYLVLNAEEPTSITVETPEYFATTEMDKAYVDSLIDFISVPIVNNMRETLFFDTSNVLVVNASSNEVMDRWSVSNADGEISVQGQGTLVLELSTDAIFDIDELSINDEFYVEIPVKRENQQNYEIFTSPNFKISLGDTQPLFVLVTQNNAYQQGSTIYLTGVVPDEMNISRDLEFAIFNYGKATNERTFTATLELENETLFTSNETFQLLTVPTSEFTNNDTVCDIDEACVVSAFNITKWMINRTKDTYRAYLSIGTQTINFDLVFVEETPSYFVTMHNQRGKNNNQWGEILQFNSKKYYETETLDLIITVWNNETPTLPLDATLQIEDLNTTAFSLDSSASVSLTVPAGNPLTTIPDENDNCGRGQSKNSACAQYTWTITRNIIQTKDKNNPIIYYTVMQPYYYFKIRWVETGLVFTFKAQVATP